MVFLYLAVLALVYFIYVTLYKPINFFKNKGIAHWNPWTTIENTIAVVTKRKLLFDVVKETYKAYSDDRYVGSFQIGIPALFIRDLDLVKRITVKDFDHFMDHRNFFAAYSEDIFNKNLFSMKGDEWREMRATLSPAFTSSKMRSMFVFMDECGKNFVDFFVNKGEDLIHVEMRDVVTKYTNDVIASSSFGIKCDSLVNPQNEFYEMGRQITDQRGLFFKFLIFGLLPVIAKVLKLTLFPQDVTDFFRRIVRETIKNREDNHIIRPDMIHLLMEARKGRLQHENSKTDTDTGFATAEESNIGKTEKYRKKDLSDDDIAAQALIFFLGGFDTTASTVSFMALELAKNPDVQAKLHEEIDETLERTAGKPTYEDVLKMKYLDQVLTETLRKWTPGFQADRMCIKDYVIKPNKPDEKPYLIKKGDMLVIPIIGFHYDPQFYPNPDRFDPDRFSDENKKNITPGSYMPFGVGPRNCIGSRFALLQIKILYFHILSKFELVFTEKTILPIELTTSGFSLRPKGGFQMGFKKRNVSNI